MANAPRGERRSRSNRSNRTRQGGNRRQRQRRPSSQQRSSAQGESRSRRGTLTRPDTGYTLHSRRVRREGSSMAALLSPRLLILVGLVLIVVIVLIVGISSCVRRNSEAASQATEEVAPKNEQDPRVAAGVSAAMTSQFTEALDQGDLLAQIAKNADKYDDTRLLELALTEPDAVPFVANYPTSDKSSTAYDGAVKRGEVPLLYNWDTHWGAVTYGDGPVAVTGSGPTTLAMAYMGLTGKTDNSPTEIAQQASKSNYADSESGSKRELFSKLATTLGLTTDAMEISPDTLLYTLNENTVAAVEVKANTLTDKAHWVLAVNVNADGSLTIYDPTSSAVSAAHNTWSPGTIAEAAESMYSITLSDEDLAKLESQGSNGNSDTDTSTGTGTGSRTGASSSSRTSTEEEE